MYNLPYPVCNGYGNVDQICRKKDKRAKDGLRDLQRQSEASRIASQ